MNKYKKLVMNTGVFAIGAFGSKVLLLLLNRLYSKYLPQDESGLKSLIDTMILFVQPVFTFALQEYLIRFGLDKNYDKKQVFIIRVFVVVFIAISALIAVYQVKSSDEAVKYIAQLMGVSWGALAGAFLAPFLYGLYWKRTTKVGCWASTACRSWACTRRGCSRSSATAAMSSATASCTALQSSAAH